MVNAIQAEIDQDAVKLTSEIKDLTVIQEKKSIELEDILNSLTNNSDISQL